MKMRNATVRIKPRFWVAAAIGLLSAHGRAEAPQLSTALKSMQLGLWEIRSRDDASLNRSVCLSDPLTILQLRHYGMSCSRFVIADTVRATTVHYSCSKAGNGQTTIRVETPRLVQIQSQGIVDRSPFAFAAEGRRVGGCGAGGAQRLH
jgi:hypothetical protein